VEKAIVMEFSTLLFSFTGRLNRAPYWLAGIAVAVTASVLLLIVFKVSGRSATAIIVACLVGLLMIWTGLALATKRLHDRDKSAWWLLLFYLAPSILQTIGHRTGPAGFILSLIGFGISIWALVEIGFLRGTAGTNSYGPDPLQLTS
jgi:uncharacterized membrane protein YhaH (DUF805 family)